MTLSTIDEFEECDEILILEGRTVVTQDTVKNIKSNEQLLAKVNKILYLAQKDKQEKKNNLNDSSQKYLAKDENTPEAFSTLNEYESHLKKGGDYYTATKSIEFFKLFNAINNSTIAYFFMIFTFTSAFCFYLLYRIQTRNFFLDWNQKIMTKFWVLLTVLTIFYKCAYQTSIVLGILTAENTLFIRLLNTFAHLAFEIFDSVSPGVIYTNFEHNINKIIYCVSAMLISFMEAFEIFLTMIVVISIFIPWFVAPLLALMIYMIFLKVIDYKKQPMQIYSNFLYSSLTSFKRAKQFMHIKYNILKVKFILK